MLLLPLSSALPQGVVLASQLPAEPIEDPAEWSWGLHPNGLGYKATNGLSAEQCLASPCQLLGTPVCETTVFHCKEFPCIQDTEVCAQYCFLLGTC